MPTREWGRGGPSERGWFELNTTRGADGRMESEVWFCAHVDPEEAETVLVEHFGSLSKALNAFGQLDGDLRKLYADIGRWLDDR